MTVKSKEPTEEEKLLFYLSFRSVLAGIELVQANLPYVAAQLGARHELKKNCETAARFANNSMRQFEELFKKTNSFQWLSAIQDENDLIRDTIRLVHHGAPTQLATLKLLISQVQEPVNPAA